MCVCVRACVCVCDDVILQGGGAGGVSGPVTGMLTVYEDQLRFDVAVESCSHLAIDDETTADESMTCVRLDRRLINSVELSDRSPLPPTPAHAPHSQ